MRHRTQTHNEKVQRKQKYQTQSAYSINHYKGNDYFQQLPAMRTRKCVNNEAAVQNPQTCKLCERKLDIP